MANKKKPGRKTSTLTEAEKLVLEEAQAWWIRHRPSDYTEDDHLANPVFDTSGVDSCLASAVARLVRERKSSPNVFEHLSPSRK